MVNKQILIGRIGKEPEVRRLENGAVVAKFSVATSERFKDKTGEFQETTEWHNIVAWSKLAEVIENYAKKGMLVYIEGKTTHRKWQDKEGNDRYSTEVVANTFRILEKRENVQEGNNTSPTPVSNAQPVTAGSDDLPF